MAELVNQCNEPEPGRMISIIYHLSWSGKDEESHLIDIPVSSSAKGVYLRDVINRFNRIRGKGMAAKFSWSSKRRYKGKIVWQDLSEGDLINLFEDNEYYLKGSMLSANGSFDLNDFPPPSSSMPETLENLIIADGRPIPILPEDPNLNLMLAGTNDSPPLSSSRPETRENQIIGDGRPIPIPILPDDPTLNLMLAGTNDSPPLSSSRPETRENLIIGDGRPIPIWPDYPEQSWMLNSPPLFSSRHETLEPIPILPDDPNLNLMLAGTNDSPPLSSSRPETRENRMIAELNLMLAAGTNDSLPLSSSRPETRENLIIDDGLPMPILPEDPKLNLMLAGTNDSPPLSSSRPETRENLTIADGRSIPILPVDPKLNLMLASPRPETRENLIISDVLPMPILPEDPELDRMLAGTTAFNPDDKQLFKLLLRKYNSEQIGAGLIHEMDIYSTEPWHLPVRFELGKNKNEAFFFTSRHNVNTRAQARAKGKKMVIKVKRTAGAGFWHYKGNKSEIVFENRWIGQKKCLTFKKRDKSKCPHWLMHEYLLQQQEEDSTGFLPISIALCSIYEKPPPNRTGVNAEPFSAHRPSLPPAPVATSMQVDGSGTLFHGVHIEDANRTIM